MNTERRAIAGVLADLCGVYGRERTVPPKVLIVLRDATKGLADTEARSLKKMEPFKDAISTAANYRSGVEALEDLRAAQEALEEGEVDEAQPLLDRVARPEVEEKQPTPAPKRATKTRRRK